jgi:hypothetical protein
MYDIGNFTLKDMTECSAVLRSIGSGAANMEEVADKIVHYFYDHIVLKKTGEKAFALIRLFKTHPYKELDKELQEFAINILGAQPDTSTMKCLVLLASAGIKQEWNSRKHSKGHKAIPLPSESFVEAFPMVRQLIQQLGLELNTVLQPDQNIVMDMAQKTYNVFCVSEAVGSEYVGAQEEFVIPLGIRSVLGFGGMLPSGNLFTIIMFSKIPIQRGATTEMFRTLALSVKVALLPFDGKVIFS